MPMFFLDGLAEKNVPTAEKLRGEQTSIVQMRGIAAVAAEGWDPIVLRREQLNHPDIGHVLEE
jgi:hypothetical protein